MHPEKPSFSFESPEQHVFEKLRPLLHKFKEMHNDQLNRMKSFVLTIARINGKDCILLSTDGSDPFTFNSNFKGISHFNKYLKMVLQTYST